MDVLARKSTKLKPFNEGESRPPVPAFPPPALPGGERYCKVIARMQPSSVEAEGSTVEGLAQLLSLFMDRPVIDRTGLAARFNMSLSFGLDRTTARLLPPGAELPSESQGISIFTAIEQQLGLKLIRARGPRQLLVIDHIERPTAN